MPQPAVSMLPLANTNAVLSGLLWRELPRHLLDGAHKRALTLGISSTLLAELADVIVRDKFGPWVLAAQTQPIVSRDNDALGPREDEGIRKLLAADAPRQLKG